VDSAKSGEVQELMPSEAATMIVAHRQNVYGHPGQVYGIWAVMLEPIIGRRPSPEECSMMLILLKCAREVNSDYPKDYRDNVDDIAGYANVLHLTKEYDGSR
jgi:Domain of unknown function (DUF6378)